MADKKTTNTKEKKGVPVKIIGIAAAAVAVIAAAVLIIVLVRSVPKAVKAEVEAAVTKSYGYGVESLNTEKKFKPESSEYDSETIYLISGRLTDSLNGGKWLKDGYVLALACATTENGEETVEVRIINAFKENEKESYNQTLKELKEATADWQARFENPIK